MTTLLFKDKLAKLCKARKKQPLHIIAGLKFIQSILLLIDATDKCDPHTRSTLDHLIEFRSMKATEENQGTYNKLYLFAQLVRTCSHFSNHYTKEQRSDIMTSYLPQHALIQVERMIEKYEDEYHRVK